ncbi:hypothetical protein [Sandaracinus amylolyticus]|uniref:hypothetical protein n=1 Tax=Sandaracinus amylolyticus TaxID=927083 RepID=UPI001F42202C|nr:hypothetical protein [Sandaracinus amylolyticus]UJR85149.1 Hypothetical protein I5071_72290 [Sandaracinus amylolyticus]
MVYREPSADEVELVRALLVPRRGAIVAAVLLLAVAVVVPLSGSDVPLFAALVALVPLIETLRCTVSLRIAARGGRVVVREGALFRRTRVRELDAMTWRHVHTDERAARTWLALLPGGALLAAALAVTTEDGTEVVITSHLLGRTRMRAIAQRIVEHLALPPPIAHEHPGPAMRERIVGLGCLGLAGFLTIVILATPAILALQRRTTAGEGRLELICRERCFFDGITCLPGGTLEGSYPPGWYTVALEHREVHLRVVAGHRTTFECRDDAGIPTPVPDR